LLIDLLEAIRVRYALAARMGNELMTRLAALDAELARWREDLERPESAAKARLEVRELDELRPRIERSAHTWVDRARAIELITAACLTAAREPADDPAKPLPPSPGRIG
jgi:hypothetical protein